MSARLAHYLATEGRGTRRMRPALVSALTEENLVHTCVIERRPRDLDGDDHPAFDPHGEPLMGEWTPTLSPPVTGAAVRTPCFAWRPTGIGEFDDAERAGVDHRWRLLLPVGTALAEDDIVGDVRKDDGTVLVAGPVAIAEVAPRRGHLLAVCREVATGRDAQ